MKLFRKIMCCVMLVSLLTISTVAYYDLTDNWEYQSPIIKYEGTDAGGYNFLYDKCGSIVLLDKANSKTTTYGSFKFSINECSMYSYAYIVNDYTGATDTDSNSEINDTAMQCEALTAISEKTGTYCKWTSKMWINGVEAFNETQTRGTRN